MTRENSVVLALCSSFFFGLLSSHILSLLAGCWLEPLLGLSMIPQQPDSVSVSGSAIAARFYTENSAPCLDSQREHQFNVISKDIIAHALFVRHFRKRYYPSPPPHSILILFNRITLTIHWKRAKIKNTESIYLQYVVHTFNHGSSLSKTYLHVTLISSLAKVRAVVQTAWESSFHHLGVCTENSLDARVP